MISKSQLVIFSALLASQGLDAFNLDPVKTDRRAVVKPTASMTASTRLSRWTARDERGSAVKNMEEQSIKIVGLKSGIEAADQTVKDAEAALKEGEKKMQQLAAALPAEAQAVQTAQAEVARLTKVLAAAQASHEKEEKRVEAPVEAAEKTYNSAVKLLFPGSVDKKGIADDFDVKVLQQSAESKAGAPKEAKPDLKAAMEAKPDLKAAQDALAALNAAKDKAKEEKKTDVAVLAAKAAVDSAQADLDKATAALTAAKAKQAKAAADSTAAVTKKAELEKNVAEAIEAHTKLVAELAAAEAALAENITKLAGASTHLKLPAEKVVVPPTPASPQTAEPKASVPVADPVVTAEAVPKREPAPAARAESALSAIPEFKALEPKDVDELTAGFVKTVLGETPAKEDADNMTKIVKIAFNFNGLAEKLQTEVKKLAPKPAEGNAKNQTRRLAEKVEDSKKEDPLVNVIRETATEALTSLTQLQTKHGAKYEKVIDQATYNVFKTGVAETEAAFARAEAVIKLRDDNNSKAAELKSAKATVLGLGLGLGLGIPVLVGVVFTVLVKTNRVLLNFGSTVSADV